MFCRLELLYFCVLRIVGVMTEGVVEELIDLDGRASAQVGSIPQVSWVYHLRKSGLVAELLERNLVATGNVPELRARLIAHVRGELGETEGEVRSYGANSPSNEIVSQNRHVMDIVRRWNVKFSGVKGDSVGNFLIRVQELREGYGVSKDQLLRGLPELLKETALYWFRLNRSKFTSWSEFEFALKDRFTDYDFQEQLEREIRERTQGPSEALADYLTGLCTLLNRLEHTPSEAEQLRWAYGNMKPEYKLFIRRGDFNTLEELSCLGKEYEYIQKLKSTFRSPPNASQSVVPEAAYKPPTRRKSASSVREVEKTFQSKHDNHAIEAVALNRASPAVNQDLTRQRSLVRANSTQGLGGSTSSATLESNRLLCWNCGRVGHRFSRCSLPLNRFCFRCGRRDVTKASCRDCQSGNGKGVSVGRELGAPTRGVPSSHHKEK